MRSARLRLARDSDKASADRTIARVNGGAAEEIVAGARVEGRRGSRLWRGCAASGMGVLEQGVYCVYWGLLHEATDTTSVYCSEDGLNLLVCSQSSGSARQRTRGQPPTSERRPPCGTEAGRSSPEEHGRHFAG